MMREYKSDTPRIHPCRLGCRCHRAAILLRLKARPGASLHRTLAAPIPPLAHAADGRFYTRVLSPPGLPLDSARAGVTNQFATAKDNSYTRCPSRIARCS
jgi:hypothetical protein